MLQQRPNLAPGGVLRDIAVGWQLKTKVAQSLTQSLSAIRYSWFDWGNICPEPLSAHILHSALWLTLALSGLLSGSLWLTLAHAGSLPDSLWLPLAPSGSLWLSLAPSGSLRLSLALYCSPNLLTKPLLGSQGPCSARNAVPEFPHFNQPCSAYCHNTKTPPICTTF